MAWRRASLIDLVTLQRGFDITKAAQRLGDVPVVSSSGIGSYHDEAKAAAPGVVIGRKGTLGTVFFVDKPFWPHDTTLWVTDFHGNEPRYAYYFLKTLRLAEFDVGAANPTLNRNHIHGLPIRIPDVNSQRRIADVLATFDDLIENNTKRVKILEEMARSLYREWFVDFRFPGHEKAKVGRPSKPAVPAGWATVPARELGEYINGYAFKPDDWNTEGLPIVKIRELKNGIAAETPRYPTELPEKFRVRHGDLLFSWSADIDVYIWPNSDGWLNQHIFLVKPFAEYPRAFVYFALREAMPSFRALSNGATMKHIKRGALDQVSVLAPPALLRARFEEIVEPVLRHAGVLRQKNSILSKHRDLLLPRLLSGEIELAP